MSAPRAQANFFGDLAAGDPDAAQPASRIVDSTLGPIPSVQHRTLGPMASVQHRISGTIRACSTGSSSNYRVDALLAVER